MGDVIQLYKDNPGNGAREALARIIKDTDENMLRTDYILLMLWSEGFKVVPVDTP